jgi:hypothetical protein
MNITKVTEDSMVYRNFKKKTKLYMDYLRGLMSASYFNGTFEVLGDDELMIRFKYLGRKFEIRGEIPVNQNIEMNIATYMELEEKLKDDVLVFAFNVDKSGEIENRYAEDTFAEPYIENFVLKTRELQEKLGKSNVIR